MTATQERAEAAFSTNPHQDRERLVQTARDLVPLLRGNAGQSERDRRLPEESSEALRKAGLYQLMAPRRCGGSEADFRTYLEVCAELARGDSAAAWITMIFGGGAYCMGLFGDQAREDVYGADPTAAVAGQLTPSAQSKVVDGGYVISGRWMWASGSYQAQWTVSAYPVLDEQGQLSDLRLALLPTSELTIEDSWFVAGMAGTNSNTFVANELFVPEHRTLSLLALGAGVKPSEHTDEPLYRSAAVTGLTLAVTGPILGLAEAAWDATLTTIGKGKAIAYSVYTDLKQSPSYQLNLADARGAIDSARLHLFRAAEDLDRGARDDVVLDDLDRARIRSDMAVAVKRAREAVELLLNIGGAGSFATANPLQRIWRDLGTATRHGYVNADLGREIYARALLGLDQVSPSF
ncbi:MAG TPA: acyl-CoA dehydrogenase family protein [Amycolatopsis sp.]|nr:acyl-CoA dehydrogenase family protein [Amycolatopsis sp.]